MDSIAGKKIITPNPISLTTNHLFLAFDGEALGSGTGFIYKKNDQFYLITNWHVVSGRRPDTNECISDTGGIPNVMITVFREKKNPAKCHREEMRLYTGKKFEKPIWKTHPKYGNKVDVVAIKLPKKITSKYEMYAINAIKFDSEFAEETADEAFVIGYPFEKPTALYLPIWKKASIASEPGIDVDRVPKFFIDTATRHGLSGSPVIMQRIGVHGVVDGVATKDSSFGQIRNFIGIYSGRVGNDEFKAQLGIVWKAKVIDEIIK